MAYAKNGVVVAYNLSYILMFIGNCIVGDKGFITMFDVGDMLGLAKVTLTKKF